MVQKINLTPSQYSKKIYAATTMKNLSIAIKIGGGVGCFDIDPILKQ